jgi:HD superfamily phosphohydrolase
MIYSRRFGAFMPIVSLATTLGVTFVIQPHLERWFPEQWKIVIWFVGLALFGLFFCLAYALTLASIRFGARSDLEPKLRKRWRDTLLSSTAPQLPVEDYTDRVADLQIRMSVPSLVRGVVTDLLAEQRATCASLQRTIDHYSNNNELRAFISALGNQWKTLKEFVICSPVLIDDPVHGCIMLDSTLATLIAQPIVQRLSRIRQLSFSYRHFPSATHSRFSHVLGVAHNVERALSGIFSRRVCYEEGAATPVDLPKDILDQRDEIIRRAKVLAVLHDLGHGPFGHALDNYVGYMNRYEKTPNPDKVYSRLYVERHLSAVLKNLSFDPDDLIRVLNPKERAFLTGFDPLIGDLIDSSMDMDRMDYLMRDAHMTGLSMGFTNADALIQCVRPVRSGDAYLLAYDESGVEYMEHLLYAREAMYRSCYEHPRKRAAERLFERLVRQIAADDPETIDDIYIVTDDELLCAMRLGDLKSELARRLLEQLITNSDYVVIHDVAANSRDISEEARVWVKGATVGKGKQSYIDRPAEWEDAIARGSIGPERSFEIQVIVAPPSAYEQRFDAATILFRDDNGVYRTQEFFEVASGVKGVLSAMNPARARIKVMGSAGLSQSEREKIRQASVAQLGA